MRERRVFSVQVHDGKALCPLCAMSVYVSGVLSHIQGAHPKSMPRVVSLRLEAELEDDAP